MKKTPNKPPQQSLNNLSRYWSIVATEKAVRKKPQRVVLFELPLVVFFAKASEQFVALQDRCPHRNAPLSAGKVCDDAIQCPYHGWQFDGTGRLTNIPALPDDEQPEINIPHYHCMAQDGYIWVCLAENPAQEKPLPFPHLHDSGWHSFRLRTLFNAPVEQCLENFLDCPHAVYVHHSWFRSATGKSVSAVVRALPDGAEVEYTDEPREKSLVWGLGLQKKSSDIRHTDRFIAPATSRVDYVFSDDKHYIITSSCTPISADKTEVFTVISYRYGKWGALVRLFFEPLSRVIIKQDVNIMQKQRDNIRDFGEERFYHSKIDFLMPHILAWREAIANDEKSPEPFEAQQQTIIL